jgi:hypothetical protein
MSGHYDRIRRPNFNAPYSQIYAFNAFEQHYAPYASYPEYESGCKCGQQKPGSVFAQFLRNEEQTERIIKEEGNQSKEIKFSFFRNCGSRGEQAVQRLPDQLES